jgi:hypothetical protein
MGVLTTLLIAALPPWRAALTTAFLVSPSPYLSRNLPSLLAAKAITSLASFQTQQTYSVIHFFDLHVVYDLDHKEIGLAQTGFQ